MLHCLKAWRCYVEGRPIELVTDHESLKWLLDPEGVGPTTGKVGPNSSPLLT